MAEYRIVAKVDPQTAAGTNKVKQDLRGVQNEARATENALNRSFDQAKFDRTIGSLVNRLEQLDKTLSGIGATSARAQRQNETLGQSLDRMAASGTKAAGAAQQQGRSTESNAQSQARLEAALKRVLAATDQEAAEQMRLNALLADAKRLLDAGVISQERYAQVQLQVAQTGQATTGMLGAQRAGWQQLGFQANDVITMWTLGARPAQIFGSQIGQITQAVQMASGGTSKFAAFLGGPWGVLLSLGVIALVPLVSKLMEGNDALDDAIKKLRDDARETETNRRAKEAFTRTLEGQVAAMKELNEELVEATKSQRQQAMEALRQAHTQLANLRTTRAEREAALREAHEGLQRLRELFERGPPAGTQDASAWTAGILAGINQARGEVQRLEQAVANAQRSISQGEQAVRAARVPIQEDLAQSLVDPVAAINREFDMRRDALVTEALADKTNELSDALDNNLLKLEQQRRKAVEAAEAQEKLSKATGVATFKTREQAIGIAGREFQQAGFRVGENEQFGGVQGNHPGMGNAAHGRFAIDINEGVGVVEADVPDIKARFDAAAQRYQARGYRVLWNGWVYEAGGNGPTRRIPAGQNQHRDHMHLEAPGTIVGRPTQASSETQARREESQLAKVEERAADFVTGVVNRAASQGIPANRQSELDAAVNEALLEFERRFDRVATEGEKATITKALTDADAREIARRFEESYVLPLQRLQDLQGKVGIERDILNAKLEETARLGRELTPVEAQMIENGIRQSDQLERQAGILSQINGPLEEYRGQIAALNDLLATGEISQAQFNQRMNELTASASQFKAGLPGLNAQGVAFSEQGDREEAARERDEQLAQLEAYLQEGTILESEAASVRLAIWRQYHEQLRQIEVGRLDNARDVFAQLSQLQSSQSRELAAVGKAAAITTATIDAYVAINKALATLPPPFNIAMAGAIGATAFANVASIIGLKDGGRVRGPGGPRGDKIPANLSDGEFVVNARATEENLPLLEAINSGRQVRQAGGGGGAAGGSGMANVTVQPAPPATVVIRQVNVSDPRMVDDYFATPDGEQLFVNLLNRFPEAVSQAAQSGT